MLRPVVLIQFAMIILSAALVGCGGKAPETHALLVPGHYPPPSQPTPRLKVALPDVAIGYSQGTAPDVDLMAVASDQLLGLLQSSNRFDLTERQRLHQVLVEQNHVDMIQPGHLVHPGTIRGIDSLMLGQINDLSIRKQSGPDTLSVDGLMEKSRIQKVIPRLEIDANVNLTLVDIKTGAAQVSSSSKFHLIARPDELGLKLTADQLNELSEVRLGPEDTQTVLRYILDEPIRPMLPRIDRWALNFTPTPVSPLAANNSGPQSPTTSTATGAVKSTAPRLLICPECGAKLTGDEEFCPTCHHKLK